MTAVGRGIELLSVPRLQLPPLALAFRDQLAAEVGLCLEVCLTAFVVYAQLVENLPNDDELYRPREVDRAWFASQIKERR